MISMDHVVQFTEVYLLSFPGQSLQYFLTFLSNQDDIADLFLVFPQTQLIYLSVIMFDVLMSIAVSVMYFSKLTTSFLVCKYSAGRADRSCCDNKLTCECSCDYEENGIV